MTCDCSHPYAAPGAACPVCLERVPMRIRFALTDGRIVAEHRFMSPREFNEANERSDTATGGTWQWVSV